MAQKRKNKQMSIHNERKHNIIQRHIRELGLKSIEAYKTWCRENHFSSSLNKTSIQRQKEIDVAKAAIATQLLSAEKKGRNLQDIIPKIYSNKIRESELRNGIAKEIALAFKRSKSPKLLLRFLLYLEKNSDLLDDISYIKAIETIARHYKSWVRPLEHWQIKRHNQAHQFSGLLRHLFATYSVPAFMDNVWFSEDETHQKWYIHIGSGQNIRTAPGLPTALTKKMAHYFLHTPKQYNMDEALRWGQVHALGGNKRLLDAFRGTRLIQDFAHDDFWLNVFRFFIANPMLDVNHVNPIIDYIWNQKYQIQQVVVERGVVEEHDPPQPNFSMKGRTPESLLKQVNDWHIALGKVQRGGKLQWMPSDIGEFQIRIKDNQKKQSKIFRIRELLSTDELIYDGSKMRHCVRTYSESCYNGKTSIWTMESMDEVGEELKKVLTIEVSLKERSVNQVRGKQNRLPTQSEMSIIRRWTTKEKLSIANYVNVAQN
ncbi:hypothetical protein F4X73_00170 [Candidatus Poribacteria bacterium]|nr:hypothetical protein [Candidatus Poribacteria bacterium]MYF56834.1 hypothetical protein [Candidatus Poribacteria bacterium]